MHPWCIETQDTAKPVAVFMTIRNGARQPDRLLRATTSIAAKAELRAAGADGNVVASVEVPSRGAVDLKRDGPQVRLSGVKKQLGAYDSFMMTLVFERAGKVQGRGHGGGGIDTRAREALKQASRGGEDQ